MKKKRVLSYTELLVALRIEYKHLRTDIPINNVWNLISTDSADSTTKWLCSEDAYINLQQLVKMSAAKNLSSVLNVGAYVLNLQQFYIRGKYFEGFSVYDKVCADQKGVYMYENIEDNPGYIKEYNNSIGLVNRR